MNQDFKDLLSAFNDRKVEYLVVGAHALAAHGHVRATKDLDLWIRPEPENARRVLGAFGDFGAPIGDLSEKDLAQLGMVFQIGVPPLRIDIVTEIDGVQFSDAWPERMPSKLGGLSVYVLSKKHLIENKRAAGRRQDLADLERLGETP